MRFYDFKARKMNGQEVRMDNYQGKVVLVVNTASKCGFTPQLAELEQLYTDYQDKGFEILGFPCKLGLFNNSLLLRISLKSSL